MIGRAASSNPWIFRQIAQYLEIGAYNQPAARPLRHHAAVLRHADGTQREDTVGKMKQFATYFTHGVRHGGELRALIHRAQEASAIVGLVDEFFPGRAGGGAVKQIRLITDGSCLGNPGRAAGRPFALRSPQEGDVGMCAPHHQ